MAREKGTGSLQLEKSGRWTMRVGIKGKRYSRQQVHTGRIKCRFCGKWLLCCYCYWLCKYAYDKCKDCESYNNGQQHYRRWYSSVGYNANIYGG